jgi:hypothetical protein
MGRITTNFLNAQLKDLDADGGKKKQKARLTAGFFFGNCMGHCKYYGGNNET